MQRCPSSPKFMKRPFIADGGRGARLPFLRSALSTVPPSAQRDSFELRKKMSLRFSLRGREYQPAAWVKCPMLLQSCHQFIVDRNIASFGSFRGEFQVRLWL